MSEEAARKYADRAIDLLVLGLGNVILGDDGLGAAAVARLESRYRLPEGVRLEDGGTLGLALLDLIGEARYLILVEAVRTGEPPGTLGPARQRGCHGRGARPPVSAPGGCRRPARRGAAGRLLSCDRNPAWLDAGNH